MNRGREDSMVGRFIYGRPQGPSQNLESCHQQFPRCNGVVRVEKLGKPESISHEESTQFETPGESRIAQCDGDKRSANQLVRAFHTSSKLELERPGGQDIDGVGTFPVPRSIPKSFRV